MKEEMEYGLQFFCLHCGYTFKDEELNTIAVRRTDAVICPKCGKVTNLQDVIALPEKED